MVGEFGGIMEAVVASGAATDWEVASQREMGFWRTRGFSRARWELLEEGVEPSNDGT